jgi:hypothetical protein
MTSRPHHRRSELGVVISRAHIVNELAEVRSDDGAVDALLLRPAEESFAVFWRKFVVVFWGESHAWAAEPVACDGRLELMITSEVCTDVCYVTAG